jgi:ribosome-associated translation inhibitor RaiA
MEMPVEITFRDMDPSPAIEARIREEAEKLSKFDGRLGGCRVRVEAPHRRHHKGKVYHVTVEVEAPRNTLVVSRDRELDHSHEDVYVAIRDAFHAARRRVQEDARRRRGAVKAAVKPPPADELEPE